MKELARGHGCDVVEAQTVREFLEYLAVGGSQWQGAQQGDLAYRGQAVSAWSLLPKAFRDDVLEPVEGVPGRRRVIQQARAEFDLLQELWREADALGFTIPEPAVPLVLKDSPDDVFPTTTWPHEWPQEELWQALALAQHHGATTRLLDFTELPLVAAFWAAYHSWHRRRKGHTVEEEPYISVWVIDLRFIRTIEGMKGKRSERIGVIRVPRGNNAYLHAQAAFFLIDRGANDLMNVNNILSLESAVIERALYWQYGDRLKKRGVPNNWFGEVPIRQVVLGSQWVPELLRELATRGITKGSLMPTLDNIVESMELKREIAEVE